MDYGKLSLTRKPHQPLFIQYTDEHGHQQEIILHVSQIAGEQVRLAIEAPKAVNIVRGELLQDQAVRVESIA